MYITNKQQKRKNNKEKKIYIHTYNDATHTIQLHKNKNALVGKLLFFFLFYMIMLLQGG